MAKEQCKWFLYDYRTLTPYEHDEDTDGEERTYWRLPVRYKKVLKYCPYCGKEIDYSEVDAELAERHKEKDD